MTDTIKIKLFRLPVSGGGMLHGRREARVVEWPADQTLPQGGERVADDLPVSEWAEEQI